MNPVKTGLVKKIADYEWSSYRHNALGHTDHLITEHELYKDLGANSKQRSESYRKMLDELNLTKQENQITEATMRGEVFGSSGFHSKLSKLITRPTKLTSHGGDRKSEEYQNQAAGSLIITKK